jgi:hypothetical protein
MNTSTARNALLLIASVFMLASTFHRPLGFSDRWEVLLLFPAGICLLALFLLQRRTSSAANLFSGEPCNYAEALLVFCCVGCAHFHRGVFPHTIYGSAIICATPRAGERRQFHKLCLPDLAVLSEARSFEAATPWHYFSYCGACLFRFVPGVYQVMRLTNR